MQNRMRTVQQMYFARSHIFPPGECISSSPSSFADNILNMMYLFALPRALRWSLQTTTIVVSEMVWQVRAVEDDLQSVSIGCHIECEKMGMHLYNVGAVHQCNDFRLPTTMFPFAWCIYPLFLLVLVRLTAAQPSTNATCQLQYATVSCYVRI